MRVRDGEVDGDDVLGDADEKREIMYVDISIEREALVIFF
jgi:hypothetical protein